MRLTAEDRDTLEGLIASGHAAHGETMPGMLTDAQLKQLDEARGKEFDRLFLTFMIQHHKGAVTMVQELFDTTGAAQDISVYKLAMTWPLDPACGSGRGGSA